MPTSICERPSPIGKDTLPIDAAHGMSSFSLLACVAVGVVTTAAVTVIVTTAVATAAAVTVIVTTAVATAAAVTGTSRRCSSSHWQCMVWLPAQRCCSFER